MHRHLLVRPSPSRHPSVVSVRAARLPVLFFFNDAATTEIYTLSLHDALPISSSHAPGDKAPPASSARCRADDAGGDRKSTRLNSSHLGISYAVFCLKKKKTDTSDRAVQQQPSVATRCVLAPDNVKCSPVAHAQ